MPLYTEEQLSMILSAHAAGILTRHGEADFGLEWCNGVGCINQVAFNEPDFIVATNGHGEPGERAATWFDSHYLPDMPAEDLLRKLESF